MRLSLSAMTFASFLKFVDMSKRLNVNQLSPDTFEAADVSNIAKYTLSLGSQSQTVDGAGRPS